MNTLHPNYLILVNAQVQALLFDYTPLEAWLEDRGRRVVSSVGLTHYAVLISTDEKIPEIERAMRRHLGPPDDFRVIPVQDFAWPSALPDDATLRQWLAERADWQEWISGHS
jgi:hypothetical protein